MTRKKRRRTPVPLINPIDMAIQRACKITPARRAELVKACADALHQLLQGRGDNPGWAELADAMNIAEALCELQIANNLVDTVTQAQAALAAVIQRAKHTRCWTLYATEINALREGLWLYGVQLEHCSAGEHLRAMELVRRRIAGALAGNASARATIHQVTL